MQRAILLVGLAMTLQVTVAWAKGVDPLSQRGLEASWYGAVETVSSERVIIKNEEGRFSISKRLIQEVKGSVQARAGEYFELTLPLTQYLGRVEKNRALYLVKELGRMPASAGPAVEEKKN